jgi:hypothetical protein
LDRLVGVIRVNGVCPGGETGVAPAAEGGAGRVGRVGECLLPAVYEMAGLRDIFKDDEQVILLIAGEGEWFPGIICDER